MRKPQNRPAVPPLVMIAKLFVKRVSHVTLVAFGQCWSLIIAGILTK